jgi:hypothetical protein
VLLGEEAEIEFKASSQFQNVGVTVPGRLLEWYRRIEHWDREFKNLPKQVVAILGLDTYGGEFGLYLGIGRGEEPGKQFKECRRTLVVALRSETRYKQTFEIISQAYGIKRHEWDEEGMGELLEFIIELNGVVHSHISQ